MQTAPMRGHLFILGLMFLGISSAAWADDQPICADRPSKSTGPCTVPQGKWQIETGLIDWSRNRSGGFTADTATWGSSLIKYGVSSDADIELGITPLAMLSVRAGNSRERHSSFGDMVIRTKYRLTLDDAPVQVAIDPFVKIPSANHHLGNGKAEAGFLVAASAVLGRSGFTLSLDPELDLNADADGSGHHLATQQVVNLGVAVSDKVSLSTDLWGKWDRDPAGTGKQVSWDIAGSYLATKTLQLDAGANFGLNRQTPDFEVYSGVSVRF